MKPETRNMLERLVSVGMVLLGVIFGNYTIVCLGIAYFIYKLAD